MKFFSRLSRGSREGDEYLARLEARFPGDALVFVLLAELKRFSIPAVIACTVSSGWGVDSARHYAKHNVTLWQRPTPCGKGTVPPTLPQ